MAYLGVFVSAFLAATLIPLSSEVVLAALTAASSGDLVALWALWALATLGNTLGALVNWALGRWLRHFQGRRWFPFAAARMQRAQRWFGRWGAWTLLLAWLPIIGDPLTFVAGLLRLRLDLFLVLVALGKGARYAIVVLLSQGLAG